MEKEIRSELDKLWEKINYLENKINNTDTPKNTHLKEKTEAFKLQDKIETFCKGNDIEEEKLREIIDFQEDMPHLLVLPKEKTRTKMQLNTILILAFIFKKVYQKDVSKKNTRELLDSSNCPTDRMDKLYGSNSYKNFFGKPGLVWKGEQAAIKKIKELISNAK